MNSKHLGKGAEIVGACMRRYERTYVTGKKRTRTGAGGRLLCSLSPVPACSCRACLLLLCLPVGGACLLAVGPCELLVFLS